MINTTDLLFGANTFWVVHWMKQITKAEFVTNEKNYRNNYINLEDSFEAQAARKKSQHWYGWFCVIGLDMWRIQRTKLSLESVKRLTFLCCRRTFHKQMYRYIHTSMHAYTNTLLEVDSLSRFPGKMLNIPKDSLEPSMRNGGESEN